MRTKPIVIGVVGIVLLVFFALFFIAFWASSPFITVRHAKSVRSGEITFATFEVTNHTSNRYFLFPQLVEAKDGASWKTCFKIGDPPETELKPFRCNSLTVEMTNIPSGSCLRLSLLVVKELRGLRGFPGMLRLRFIDKVADVPLNPFDKAEAIGSHAISIASEEFVEPGPMTITLPVR